MRIRRTRFRIINDRSRWKIRNTTIRFWVFPYHVWHGPSLHSKGGRQREMDERQRIRCTVTKWDQPSSSNSWFSRFWDWDRYVVHLGVRRSCLQCRSLSGNISENGVLMRPDVGSSLNGLIPLLLRSYLDIDEEGESRHGARLLDSLDEGPPVNPLS